MVTDAPDKAKRINNVFFYAGMVLLLYVLSYLPVHVGLAWAYGLNPPRSVYRVLNVVDWPVNKSLAATGHLDEANAICFWLVWNLP